MSCRPHNSVAPRAIALAIAVLCAASCRLQPETAPKQESAVNLLSMPNPEPGPPNGEFPPMGWRSFGPANSARLSAPAGAPPEIEIVNPTPAIAGMRRMISLSGTGWHEFSAEIRVDSVSQSGAGAQLAVELGNGMILPAPWLHGATGWRKIEFYYRPPRRRQSQSVTVLCRLGEFGRPSAGEAYFRNLELADIAGRPHSIAARFDGKNLMSDPAMAFKPPSGGLQPDLLIVLLGCAAIAALGWRLLSPRP